MPTLNMHGPLLVAADPYVETARQNAVFDADLTKAGVLAVQLLMRNEGPSRVLVQRADIFLELPGGMVVPPAQKTAVVYLASWGHRTGGGVPPVPPIVIQQLSGASLGPATAASSAMALSNLPNIIAADRDLKDRLEDYRSKEFQDTTLSQGESVYGFVYFIPPPTQSFSEATLTIPIANIDEVSRITARLKLTRLGFKGPAAATKKEIGTEKVKAD